MSEEGEKAAKPAETPAERPTCANCGKPAIVLFGGYPACIDCKYKVDMGNWMQFAQNATMYNLSAEEIDYAIPFGPMTPKIEIPRAPVAPISYNHQSVSVTGGNVGVINFGNVEQIQANLQSLVETGSPDLVQPLKELTDAIVNAGEADEAAKNELLEQVATLTELASAKPEDRKTGVVKALLSGIRQGAQTIGSVAGAWAAVEPLLKSHFGL